MSFFLGVEAAVLPPPPTIGGVLACPTDWTRADLSSSRMSMRTSPVSPRNGPCNHSTVATTAAPSRHVVAA